jgi:hypothetical protein
LFGQFLPVDNVSEARSACANSVFSTPKVRRTAFASPSRSGRIARHEHALARRRSVICLLMALSGHSLRRKIWSLLDQSGQRWILAGDGLSAYDQKRKWSVHRSSRADVNLCGRPTPVVRAVPELIWRMLVEFLILARQPRLSCQPLVCLIGLYRGVWLLPFS